MLSFLLMMKICGLQQAEERMPEAARHRQRRGHEAFCFYFFLGAVIAFCGVIWMQVGNAVDASNNSAPLQDLLLIQQQANATANVKVKVDSETNNMSPSTRMHSCPPPRRKTRRETAISPSSPTTPSTVLCAMAKDEEAYLDEWVNYHLAIGFETIYLYDNSETNELRQWGQAKSLSVKQRDLRMATMACSQDEAGNTAGDEALVLSRVQVIPWPGEARQFDAYWDCGNRSKYESIGGFTKNSYNGQSTETPFLIEPATWAAFWDIDEFLILHKHKSVVEFLQQYLTSGSLAISWIIMSGSTKFPDSKETEQRQVYSPLPVNEALLVSRHF